VHMNVLGQRLPPGRQDRRAAKFCPSMVRVLGKLLQGLGSRVEQQVVEAALIHADQGGDGVR
jgi:hypothetical protein